MHPAEQHHLSVLLTSRVWSEGAAAPTSLNLPSGRREALASKGVDVLREMLQLVYRAEIEAQCDEHIGADREGLTDDCDNLRNGSRRERLATSQISESRTELGTVPPDALDEKLHSTIVARFAGGRDRFEILPPGASALRVITIPDSVWRIAEEHD